MTVVLAEQLRREAARRDRMGDDQIARELYERALAVDEAKRHLDLSREVRS